MNVVCTDPERDIGDECFCVCADTGPAARDHFDLQLMDLGEGIHGRGRHAGRARHFSPSPSSARPPPAHVEKRRAILDEVRKQLQDHAPAGFPPPSATSRRATILDKTWEEIGNRCLECGGCTYVCPACTCFTVTDRQVGPEEIERVRIWDSCALGGFTRMAGGHNPRRPCTTAATAASSASWRITSSSANCPWPAWAAGAAPPFATATSACPAWWR